MHRRPDFIEQKPGPNLIKPTAGPPSINRNDNQNQNPNNHHASTTNDQSAKPEQVIQQPPGPNATTNNRSVKSNTTTNTTWKGKSAVQQNSSHPTPNAGNVATNVYKPPPPKNQPTVAPPTAPKQQPQQQGVKPETTGPATTSMDVDYMAGEDDMSFFESEDEKWMMGDFEIDLDIDLGRPIDFEADESATNQQEDSGFLDADAPGNVDPRKGTPSASGQRKGAGSGPGSGHDSNVNTDGNGGSAQRSAGSNLVNSTSVGANPNGNGGKEVRFHPLPNVHSSGNGNNRGQPPHGSNGNGSNGSGGRTSGRPSAGGFSFPPGVVRRIFFPFRCQP